MEAKGIYRATQPTTWSKGPLGDEHKLNSTASWSNDSTILYGNGMVPSTASGLPGQDPRFVIQELLKLDLGL